jgi:hypothetical protein
MEYFCDYCHEWYDVLYCETHFQSAHGQEGVTFERLQARRANIGGVDTRDEREAALAEEERPPFVTNNFRHTL